MTARPQHPQLTQQLPRSVVSVKRVQELEPESKGHNLHVKVMELRTVLEKTRFDGTKITIGEVRYRISQHSTEARRSEWAEAE